MSDPHEIVDEPRPDEREASVSDAAEAARALRFQRTFLVIAALAISVLFLSMIQAFVMPLLLAAIFAGLFSPLYRWMLPWVRGRSSLASAAVVLAVLLLVLGPLTAFFGLVASQALQVTESVGPWIERNIQGGEGPSELLRHLPFADQMPWLQGIAPESEELVGKLGEAVSRAGSYLVGGLGAITRGTAAFFLQLFVLLYAMFFFLQGGGRVLDRILYYIPLEPEDERMLVDRFTSVTRATIKGSLLVGIAQGTLAGLAFAVLGVPAAAFWGTVMAVLSFIPGIGAPLVWIPAVVWLWLEGRPGSAIGLAVWCGAAVGSIDNVLRPRLVGADAKMPDVLILLSTLGGITMFGVIGVVIGPIVAAIFVSIWEVYGRAFKPLLPPQPE